MRQVLIDELSPGDVEKLRAYLTAHAEASALDGLYWVEVSRDLLDPRQYETEADHPFCFAVEVGDAWARFEFLIRSRSNMNSLGTGYANAAQQKLIVDYSNFVIETLDLAT